MQRNYCRFSAFRRPIMGLLVAMGLQVAIYLLAATYLLAAAGAVSTAWAVEMQHGAAAVSCTNPASGATWDIQIDYDRSTVDTNPARITEAAITWRDQKGWNYTLDRKSGKLTVILASSTGGNFLFDQCKLGH